MHEKMAHTWWIIHKNHFKVTAIDSLDVILFERGDTVEKRVRSAS